MAEDIRYTCTSNTVKLFKHLDTLQNIQHSKVIPIMVHTMPTHVCNMNCVYCCFKHRQDKALEMPYEMYIEGIRQFYNLGTRAMEMSLRGDELVPNIDNSGFLRLTRIDKLVEQQYNYNAFTLDNTNSFIQDKITQYIKHEQTESLFRITLQGGRNITTTKSHSIFFYENNQIIYKPVSDAKIGDLVVLNKAKPSINEIDIDSDFARFLGYFAAEGSFTFQRKHVPHGITFTFGSYEDIFEKKYIDDTLSISKKLGYTTQLYKHKNKTNIIIDNKSLCELLLLSGIGQGAHNKRVPDIILNSSFAAKMEFLKGYYAGDGNFRDTKSKGSNRNVLHIKSCSKEMQVTLSYLLDLIGVRHTVDKGVNEQRFIEGRKLAPSIYYYIEVGNRLSLEKLVDIIVFIGGKTSYKDSPYSHTNNGIKYIDINEDCYALKIRKIEELDNIEEYVYDISVGNTHRFESSFRILCHNTGGGEPTMWSELPKAMTEFHSWGMHIGVNTNCKEPTRLSKEIWGLCDWVRASMNLFDYQDNMDVSIIKNSGTHLSACYIWNQLSNFSKLQNVVKFCNDEKIACRIAPDCIVPTGEIDNSLDKIRDMLSQIPNNKYVFLSDFNIDTSSRPENLCYIHMIKPCFYTDGNIYACPSAELAIENKNQVQMKTFICRYDKVEEFYNSPEAVKPKVIDCSYCKYVKQQEVLQEVLMETTDNAFA